MGSRTRSCFGLGLYFVTTGEARGIRVEGRATVVADQRTSDDLVVDRASCHRRTSGSTTGCEEIQDVARIERGGVGRDPGAGVWRPTIFTPFLSTTTGPAPSARRCRPAPWRDRRSPSSVSWRRPFHRGPMSTGAGRPGIRAVETMMSTALQRFGDELSLAAPSIPAHRPRVAAHALSADRSFSSSSGGRNVDPLRAERFDLLFHGRPHVGRLDHRAKALGGRDGLQARDADAQDQHPRRLDGSRRRHQHRHEARTQTLAASTTAL